MARVLAAAGTSGGGIRRGAQDGRRDHGVVCVLPVDLVVAGRRAVPETRVARDPVGGHLSPQRRVAGRASARGPRSSRGAPGAGSPRMARAVLTKARKNSSRARSWAALNAWALATASSLRRSKTAWMRRIRSLAGSGPGR